MVKIKREYFSQDSKLIRIQIERDQLATEAKYRRKAMLATKSFLSPETMSILRRDLLEYISDHKPVSLHPVRLRYYIRALENFAASKPPKSPWCGTQDGYIADREGAAADAKYYKALLKAVTK